MRNFFSARIANRIVQLFGRINRGRKDYGVFIIRGGELSAWLKNERNRALLTPLLQQQLAFGEFVQEGVGISSAKSILEITGKVLGRSADWIKLYSENIDKTALNRQARARAATIEERLIEAAKAEARYGAFLWEGEFAKARGALEEGIEDLSYTDDVVAGWHNALIGGCYEIEGDTGSALVNYQKARARLGVNFTYPRSLSSEEAGDPTAVGRMERILNLLQIVSPNTFSRQFNRWKLSLSSLSGGSYAQVEEGLRALGELLGFEATRPDNQFQTGPDVLWRDPVAKKLLPLEVKSDKEENGTYYKKEISQLGDSSNWVEENYPGDSTLRKMIVGPGGSCARDANPDDMMWLSLLGSFASLRDEVTAMIEDLRKLPPAERTRRLEAVGADGRYNLSTLAERLQFRKFRDLKS